MKSISRVTFATTLISLASTSAIARTRAIMPRLQLHGLNPSQSLSAPVRNPLQSQIQNDYATNLMAEQRALLQQNSSGVTR
jgi:hypothetical protein